MIGHPSEDLFEEMAYLARVAHWPHDQLIGLTHDERRRWLREFERLVAREADSVGSGDAAWR
jgi:hypothetical protein